MKYKFVSVGLACLAGVASLTTEALIAQTTSGSSSTNDATSASSAQISTDSGAVFTLRKQNRHFERIGLRPGQVTNIKVQFSVATAGQTIVAAALDGGVLALNDQGTIDQRGMASMTYKAASTVGQYRVLVSQGDSVQILQFWVRDLANPQNNPPVYPGS